MPLVSVITVSYNHAKFIKRCIESVLAQTSENWEQVIVDDGSSDGTPELVNKYCSNDSRIRCIEHEHFGFYRLSESYNMALAESRGDYVAVLEGDDYWPAWKLEKQVPVFNSEDAVLSWGRILEVDQEGVPLQRHPANPKRYLGMGRGDMVRELLLGCFIPAVSVMCRRSPLDSIGGFRQPHQLHCVDYPTWLALASLGDFRYVDLLLGYWVRHASGLSLRFGRSTAIHHAIARCSIDAFTDMPASLKRQVGLTETGLVRLLQHQMDMRIETDPERDFDEKELRRLVRHQLSTRAITEAAVRVPSDVRTRDIQHQVAKVAIHRGRRLFLEGSIEAAKRNFQAALLYASFTRKLESSLWIASTLVARLRFSRRIVAKLMTRLRYLKGQS